MRWTGLVDVMEPIQFIKEFGLPVGVIIAACVFVSRSVWPFCMKQIEQRYQDSQQRHTRMLGLLEKMTEQVTTQRQQSIEALHGLTSQMAELVANVANLAHLVASMAEREEHRHPSDRHR